MKFYSYTNNNKNYTKAISLANIRSIHKVEGDSCSKIRFCIQIEYMDGYSERFNFLEGDEANQVYAEILELLNQ